MAYKLMTTRTETFEAAAQRQATHMYYVLHELAAGLHRLASDGSPNYSVQLRTKMGLMRDTANNAILQVRQTYEGLLRLEDS